MLGGFTRMTMSLAVIMLEITTNLFMTLPIMLAIVVSKATGDLFTPSTYDIVVALKNIPLLEPEIETTGWKKLGTLPCKVIGCPQKNLAFVSFDRTFTVADAVQKLVTNKHHAWPVVENSDNMRLLGLLTRKKLLECLEDSELLPKETDKIDLKACAANEQELNIWKYASQDPFILAHRTSVLTAHTVFRNLGLRHLCVVDEHHAIVSLITRKDLCEIVEEFVTDYKTALKDFADKLQNAATHEFTTGSDEIQKGVSDFTLVDGGMPKGAVDFDTRDDLRQRRKDRANSETSADDAFTPSKSQAKMQEETTKMPSKSQAKMPEETTKMPAATPETCTTRSL